MVVGLYHKSDNTIDINPEETKVFSADDQIVALSTSGDLLCCAATVSASMLLLLGVHAGLRLVESSAPLLGK